VARGGVAYLAGVAAAAGWCVSAAAPNKMAAMAYKRRKLAAWRNQRWRQRQNNGGHGGAEAA